MAYCKDCDLPSVSTDTEEERNGKRTTYHVVYCSNCGIEFHRTKIREEDISTPQPDNRPKDPKSDRYW